MHGVGRKIFISAQSGTITIWEGMFKNDYLNGFGRYTRITKSKLFRSHTGYFLQGQAHGYGRRTMNFECIEGFWQHDEHMSSKAQIDAYDPKTYK